MKNKIIIFVLLIIFPSMVLAKTNDSGDYKHVFIIGIDGLGATYSKVSTPRFDRIFKNYAYRYNVKPESPSNSAPNWTSILTGVPYSSHKIHNKKATTKTRTSKTKYPTIFNYIRNANPDAKLVSIVNWNPINTGIIETDINVKKIHCGSDASVTKHVVNYLEKNKSNPPTLMFIQFDEVDAAAHKYGGYSGNYYAAARKSDTYLGEIYDKIKSIGILKDSLIIAVADHGEKSGGHGGNSKNEMSALLAVRGRTVNKMIFNSKVQNRDVAAITLKALGINIPQKFVAKVPKNLFK